MPPVELYADMYAHVYARTRELGGLGVVLTPKVKAAVRLQARRRALERYLRATGVSARTCVASVKRTAHAATIVRGGDEDTAQHTLEVCPAWAEERHVLVNVIGDIDFSLSSIVAAMLESEESWRAVTFCEAVMLQKE
ncbi:uncharacterized protein [Polyergus mexicanus]|uniref:uncharacterized protein n=1 Tax=Polyergus mexicanus TaxID=615972 RepID=UPI0038B6388A